MGHRLGEETTEGLLKWGVLSWRKGVRFFNCRRRRGSVATDRALFRGEPNDEPRLSVLYRGNHDRIRGGGKIQRFCLFTSQPALLEAATKREHWR